MKRLISSAILALSLVTLTMCGMNAQTTSHGGFSSKDEGALNRKLLEAGVMAEALTMDDRKAPDFSVEAAPDEAQIPTSLHTDYTGAVVTICTKHYYLSDNGILFPRELCHKEKSDSYGTCTHPNKHLASAVSIIQRVGNFQADATLTKAELVNEFGGNPGLLKEEYYRRYKKTYVQNIQLEGPCKRPQDPPSFKGSVFFRINSDASLPLKGLVAVCPKASPGEPVVQGCAIYSGEGRGAASVSYEARLGDQLFFSAESSNANIIDISPRQHAAQLEPIVVNVLVKPFELPYTIREVNKVVGPPSGIVYVSIGGNQEYKFEVPSGLSVRHEVRGAPGAVVLWSSPNCVPIRTVLDGKGELWDQGEAGHYIRFSCLEPIIDPIVKPPVYQE